MKLLPMEIEGYTEVIPVTQEKKCNLRYVGIFFAIAATIDVFICIITVSIRREDLPFWLSIVGYLISILFLLLDK